MARTACRARDPPVHRAGLCAERLQAPAFLQLRKFIENGGRLFARVVDEAAGVDEADFSDGGILSDQETGFGEIAKDAFAIDQILRATEVDETDDGRIVGLLLHCNHVNRRRRKQLFQIENCKMKIEIELRRAL